MINEGNKIEYIINKGSDGFNISLTFFLVINLLFFFVNYSISLYKGNLLIFGLLSFTLFCSLYILLHKKILFFNFIFLLSKDSDICIVSFGGEKAFSCFIDVTESFFTIEPMTFFNKKIPFLFYKLLFSYENEERIKESIVLYRSYCGKRIIDKELNKIKNLISK